MEINEALAAFAAAEGLHNGTAESTARSTRLIAQLIEQGPEGWWESFLDATMEDSPTRKLAEQLMLEGKITPESTFEDMRRVVAEAPVGPCHRA